MKARQRVRKSAGDGHEQDVPPAESVEMGLERFRQEMDRMIDRMWRGNPWEAALGLLAEPRMAWPELRAPWGAWPAIDVTEDEKAVVVRADVPGLDAKDITVEIAGDVLTLRGSREQEQTQKTANATRHERRFGRFGRTVALPPHVDAEKIEARYVNGTLTITIPRVPGQGPKRVGVKAS